MDSTRQLPRNASDAGDRWLKDSILPCNESRLFYGVLDLQTARFFFLWKRD